MNVAAVLLVGPRNRRRSCLLALLAAPALVGCKGQPPPPAAPSIGGSAASDGAAQAFLSLLDDAQRAAAWRDRRHRVAAVCAAGAFALLQAADLVLPRLGAPDALMTALVVLALLGAPVAIVLAWAFDLTPEGIVRTGQAEAAGHEAPVLPLLGRRMAVLVLVLEGGVGCE